MTFLFSTLFFLWSSCKKSEEPYLNTSLSFEERTEALLEQLTIDEKILLLQYKSPAIDRLNIPEHNYWNECLHGVARSGTATVFPQAIGMAAMWDKEEMFQIANAISDEARAKHHDYAAKGKRGIYQGLTYWTPNINIFRDPRWGRGMETYGEDPYLTGELAVPFIKGLQGEDKKYLKLVATAKHFVVHSGPESSRHSFDVYPSNRDMAETYTPHFKKAVQVAHVYSVMCAYNRFRGEPCCGSPVLDNLLRNEWRFKGYVVSDCGAIRDFHKKDAHEVVNSPEEAAALAVKSGTDLNCGNTYPALTKAVEQGLISEAELDVSVRRLLLARMKLGQFDPNHLVAFSNISMDVVDSKAHQAIAEEAARKSMVLLKNDGILPFSKELNKVAVIGPNADNLEVLLANYNGYPSNPITPLQGIREKLPNTEVSFAQGCELAPKLPYLELIPSEYLFTDSSTITQGLKAKYYNNSEWKGEPILSKIESRIDFIWKDKAPLPELDYDHFSVEWDGVLRPDKSGEYAIGAEGFSGFELFVNDSSIINLKGEHRPRKDYGYFKLKAGKTYPIKIRYVQDNSSYPMMQLLWCPPKDNLVQEAVDLANSSDLVILCMGLSPSLEGEEMKVKVEGFDKGDKLDVKLPEIQTALMKEIMNTGKPTVLVLLNGSAIAFNWENEHIPAILEAWYPGQSGGKAIADIIFGDYNPAGRLPLTFYKSIDQIPPFENYDMEGKTYKYFHGEPLYSFGYGLSYTHFTYDKLLVSKEIKAGENIQVSVEVTNTGNFDGDEVVQLYVSLTDAPFPVAIRSLQGFKRIHLKKGESQKVEFILSPDQFAYYNSEKDIFQVGSGNVHISVGGMQPNQNHSFSKSVLEQKVMVVGGDFDIKK
ncbi:glycoside hydrolase family 3 C-terminal domain-containing protein [Namhaeicola litoreus]|uniref:Glycoside hydrolase family 3 C-terminal domain-containing protein n=1 Tax=Namhaeicola litoreus TaxID=1052145 RepID=A0ABW3Y4L8_9FLAO